MITGTIIQKKKKLIFENNSVFKECFLLCRYLLSFETLYFFNQNCFDFYEIILF